MAGKMNFEFSFGQPSPAQRDDERQSRFYLCGDFSGQTTQAVIPDKIAKIDIDNFETFMAKLSPSLRLDSGHVLVFNELDDFHPDKLLQAVPLLAELRTLKKQLQHPQTAAQAADQIWQKYRPSVPSVNPEPSSRSEATANPLETTENTLERLLGGKPSAIKSEIKAKNAIDEYIHQLIAPHVLAETKPEHQTLRVFVDALMEKSLNEILHHPEFQALEAIWRSVYTLLFAEDEDENQSFYLLNLSKAALVTDMQQGAPSRFAALLENHGIKTANSIIIGNYSFSANPADIELLNFVGSVAEQFNSRFISAADEVWVKEQILTKQSVDKAWQAFRASPVAAYLGLCYPRMLLRLPYGKKQESIEGFEFEEFRNQPEHNQLLWGNPAFAWARLLVRQNAGYQGTETYEINNLPALVYLKDDEQQLQACGEWFFSEAQINSIFAQGIMPFISFKNRNSVRLLAGRSLQLC